MKIKTSGKKRNAVLVVGETRHAEILPAMQKNLPPVSPVELLPGSQLLAGPTRAHTPSLGQKSEPCRPVIRQLKLLLCALHGVIARAASVFRTQWCVKFTLLWQFSPCPSPSPALPIRNPSVPSCSIQVDRSSQRKDSPLLSLPFKSLLCISVVQQCLSSF